MLNELKLYVHVCIYVSAHIHTYNNNYGRDHEVEGGARGGQSWEEGEARAQVP